MGESFEHVSRAGLLAAEVLGHAPAAERLAGLPGEPVLLAIGLVFLVGLAIGFVLGRTV